MKKITYLFTVFLLLVLGACNPGPTEPNVPPESIVIVTIPFVEITTTITTASIKSTVNTNGPTSIAVEYGVGNYSSSGDFVPNSFSVNTIANAKLTNLMPNTRYQFRIKSVANGASKYLIDSSFTTSPQLQIGDSYKNGIVIEVHTTNGVQHGLLAAPVDLTPIWGIGMNYFAATEAAAKYGEGYRLPDSTEMKLVKKAKDTGILTNFVDPNYDSRGIYITSTVDSGNTDWIFCVLLYKGPDGWINKNSSASSRAVCSF